MYRVLIIDDDKLQRKGLIHIVAWDKCGMQVVGDVANGLLALEFLEAHEVDLAVVDVAMPIMSGLDFMRESRKRYPKLQYVMLSFHEDFEYVQQALRLGALDYVSKLRMEEDDCNQAFMRVSKLMDESHVAPPIKALEAEPPAASEQSGVSDQRLEQLRASICGLEWVYGETRCQCEIENLKSSGLSVRQAERLIMWTCQRVEEQFGYRAKTPYITSIDEALKWLTGCREALPGATAGALGGGRTAALVLQACEYVREHLPEHLTAERVALSVNMSRSHFSATFKALTGYTFNDFLRAERIERAKALLRERAVRVSELAAEVGYEDSKYFSRVFYELTGEYCSEYARRYSPLQQ